MSNKIREVHFKILHNVYPTNSQISSFVDISDLCVFCKVEKETLFHLFYHCNQDKPLWQSLGLYLSHFVKCDLNFSLKDIFLYFSGSDCAIDSVVNFFVLHCKFFIHKNKFLKTLPRLEAFIAEISLVVKSLKLIDNSKNKKFLKYYVQFFPI